MSVRPINDDSGVPEGKRYEPRRRERPEPAGGDPVTRRIERARSSVAQEMAQLADRLEDEVRGYDTPTLRDANGLLGRIEEMVGDLGRRIEKRIEVSDERLEAAIGRGFERSIEAQGERLDGALGGHVERIEGALRSVARSFGDAVRPFASGESGADLGVEGEKKERKLSARVRDAEKRLDSVLQSISSVEDRMRDL